MANTITSRDGSAALLRGTRPQDQGRPPSHAEDGDVTVQAGTGRYRFFAHVQRPRYGRGLQLTTREAEALILGIAQRLTTPEISALEAALEEIAAGRD